MCWSDGKTTSRGLLASTLRWRVVIYPTGEARVEVLRDEDVGFITCTGIACDALGSYDGHIRPMDDRMLSDIFTGQPVDEAAH